MMHRNLFRPVALAAVGCLLAVSLTGCSMTDFIRLAKNSKLMDEEASASSAASSAATTEKKQTLKDLIQKAQAEARARQEASASSAAAASSAASSSQAGETDAASDSQPSYDPPNAECDAKIAELTSQLYALEASANSAVSSAIQAARDEYHRTGGNKYLIAYSHLSAVQSEYDSKVSAIISEMRSVLREYNQPETVADQAESYYASAKQAMISSLL